MAVEAATFLSQLDQNLPASGGIAGEGDDHIRLVKDTIKNTIPLSGLVTADFTDLNLLSGAAAYGLTVADVSKLADIDASAAEINLLDGVLATTAELNLLAGRSLASSDDVIDNFPSGTPMLFMQQTAPTGWTRQTTHNNKSLRIVNGTTWAGSGGSVAFSTVFGRTASDSTTLTSAQSGMPAHGHSDTFAVASGGAHVHAIPSKDESGNLSSRVSEASTSTGNIGTVNTTAGEGAHTHTLTGAVSTASGVAASAGHTHPMDMRVQYVDSIIATKN